MQENVKHAIGFAVVAALIFAGFYFGYLRNEDRCYNDIDAELAADMEMLEDWATDPPDYVDYTALEILELKLSVLENNFIARNIKNDPHRSICDYYVYGMSLKRK